MKIVAAMALWKRQAVSLESIKCLTEQDYGVHVVTVGSCPEDRETAKMAGVEYREISNEFRGDKFKVLYRRARDLNADAVVWLGSDDWLSKNYVSSFVPLLEQGYGLLGMGVMYVMKVAMDAPLEIVKKEVYRHRAAIMSRAEFARWNERQQYRWMPGPGRIISKKVLSDLGWDAFIDKGWHSDEYVYAKCLSTGEPYYSHMGEDRTLLVLKVEPCVVPFEVEVHKHATHTVGTKEFFNTRFPGKLDAAQVLTRRG